MANAYFIKELISNPLLIEGRRVPFEDFGDDLGGITVSDAGLTEALRTAQRSGRGGVREVEEAEFTDTKKNAVDNELRRNSRSSANHVERLPFHRRLPAVADASGERETMRIPIPVGQIPVGAPLEKPGELPPPPPRRPSTRRLSEMAPVPPALVPPTPAA